jgi:ABC-2 type transport system permease protein
MPVQLTTIARNTFIEAIRQPIFFVLVILCGIAQIFNTWNTAFQMGYSDSSEVAGDNKFLFEIGLATIFVCGVLLAAFVATAVVSREIENKTVLTVVSKPVSRPTLIFGKYAGISGAMILALVPMMIFLLLGLRHGVMSTAADDLDQPVILFASLAVVLALGVSVWCNFFYGWYFTQTFMLLLAPGMVAAYILVLLLSKRWHFQPITHDLKVQTLFACFSLALALLVLTAVATAVSTRLGQVMTIVICSGVFLFGLLSNYLIGRHTFSNTRIGVVRSAQPDHFTEERWAETGATYSVNLVNIPTAAVRPGDSFYYSTSPNGFPYTPPRTGRFQGAIDSSLEAQPESGLVISAIDGPALKVRRYGRDPLDIPQAPQPGDFVFTAPTRIRTVTLALWSAIPNMHFFWLVDAVSQNQRIPPRHILLITGYAAAQIAAFLALGVILFQRRDVG